MKHPAIQTETTVPGARSPAAFHHVGLHLGPSFGSCEWKQREGVVSGSLGRHSFSEANQSAPGDDSAQFGHDAE